MSGYHDDDDHNESKGDRVNFWVSLKTPAPESKTYYFNTLTKQTSFKKPQEVKDYENAVKKLHRVQVPIGMRKVGATSWACVVTNLENHFWFNLVTKQTQWDCPEEIVNEILSIRNKEAQEEQEHDVSHEARELKEEAQNETMDEDITENNPVEEEDYEFGESDLEYQFSEQDQEEATGPSTEEREEQFFDLLKETKAITAVSFYSPDIQKLLAKDDRFRLVEDSKRRKILFEQYCASLISTKPVGEKKKSFEDEYNDKLKEIVQFNLEMRWEEFQLKHKKETWFIRIEHRQREKLFKEYIKNTRERTESEFRELLKESFGNKDKEWKEAKSVLKRDHRYEQVRDSQRRKEIFNEFMGNL